MAAVNYERAWLELKSVLVKKPSHSAKDLLTEMGRIEVGNVLTPEQELFDATPAHRLSDVPADEPAQAAA